MTSMKVCAPIISVIVPVYKVEQYLCECIDSILEQTFADFELLLVDDGSPDNSGKICDEYAEKDRRIRVFHKGNGGVGSARNMGIDNVLGKWICFVDSDDWVDREAFQAIISSIKNKEVDLVIWGYKLVTPRYFSYVSVPLAGYFDKKTEIEELLIQCDMNKLLESPCNKLYSTELIKMKALRFDRELLYMEDSKFNWSYFEFVSAAIAIQQSYYNYRQEPGAMSLSNNYPDNLLKLMKNSIDTRKRYLSSYSGDCRDQYNLFLEKEMEMAHLILILAMYKNKVSKKIREDSLKCLLSRGKIDAFQGSFIYTLLKTNSVFIIDMVLQIRCLLSKYIPGLFYYYHKMAKKKND